MKTDILTLQQEMVTTQPNFNLGSSKVFGTLTETSTIQYQWKDGNWKSLGEYPTLYAEFELLKLKRLYSYEYNFRLAPSKLSA